MKRIFCFLLSMLCFLYGGCYISKNGTDDLPTMTEFMEYSNEKKEWAMETYYNIKEWASEIIES